jgi:hypothetical protein
VLHRDNKRLYGLRHGEAAHAMHAASLCRGRGAHFAQRGLGSARVIEANMGLLREGEGEGGGGG